MSDAPERISLLPDDGWSWMKGTSTHEENSIEYVRADAIPAAQPTVKPGEIERAVWGAMGWALRHAKQMPGDIIPSYTDTGNSDAEVECRRSAARILSALDMQPTVSPDVAALVEALRSTLNFIENTEGEMGVILGCGDKARAALARVKGEIK